MSEFQGDEAGRVNVRFTPEALRQLVERWNAADVRSEDELRITLSAEEYQPGQAHLVATTHTVEVPA